MAFRACYNPSREVVTDDLPCLPDADESFCCAPGLVCGTNSLCYKDKDQNITDGNPFIFRGSCTDQTWNSPQCPQRCRGGLYNQWEKDDSVGIYQCHADVFECSPKEFGVDPCLYTAEIFPLPTFENITTIGGAVGPAYSATSSTPAPSASSATLTTTSISSPLSSTTSPTTSPTAAPSTESPALSTGAKAGISVAVVVAVLAVIAIFVLLYYCRRQRKETAELRQHIAGIYERQNSQRADKAWRQDQERGPSVPLQVYHKMAPVEMDSLRQVRELPASQHGP